MSKIMDSLFARTSYLSASLQKIIRLIEYYTETDGLEGCIFTFGKHGSYQAESGENKNIANLHSTLIP